MDHVIGWRGPIIPLGAHIYIYIYNEENLVGAGRN